MVLKYYHGHMWIRGSLSAHIPYHLIRIGLNFMKWMDSYILESSGSKGSRKKKRNL